MELELELELGLAIQTHSFFKEIDLDLKEIIDNKKRQLLYEADFKEIRTLPLLNWDKKHPEDDDNKNTPNSLYNHAFTFPKRNTIDRLVGWPPVKISKKKPRQSNRVNRTVNKSCALCGNSPKSLYVKVKMEGVAIARKIDVTLFNSNETLTHTLIKMFDHEDSSGYRLVYQDREGHWLVAQDVSWMTFIHSVQRLMLAKIRERSFYSSLKS